MSMVTTSPEKRAPRLKRRVVADPSIPAEESRISAAKKQRGCGSIEDEIDAKRGKSRSSRSESFKKPASDDFAEEEGSLGMEGEWEEQEEDEVVEEEEEEEEKVEKEEKEDGTELNKRRKAVKATKTDEEHDEECCFHGGPVPTDEAKLRWPHRYPQKV